MNPKKFSSGQSRHFCTSLYLDRLRACATGLADAYLWEEFREHLAGVGLGLVTIFGRTLVMLTAPLLAIPLAFARAKVNRRRGALDQECEAKRQELLNEIGQRRNNTEPGPTVQNSVCPHCDGIGDLGPYEQCPWCDGTGLGAR